MVLIELEWLGGVEGSFYAQSPTRRAQLFALWLERHAQQPAPTSKPALRAQTLPPEDFVNRMRQAYSKG